MVPACLTWLIWWECSNHTFEDIVRSIDLLKPILVGTLFQWCRTLGVLHNVFPFLNFFFLFVSLLEVLVFVLSSECSPLWTWCPFYEINLWFLIQKKKKKKIERTKNGRKTKNSISRSNKKGHQLRRLQRV